MNRAFIFSVAMLFAAATCPLLLAQTAPNSLSKPEELSGWKLLFDGTSTDGWRNYKKDKVSDGWKIEDGALTRAEQGAGDIITKDQYKYFELSLEYKISKAGNSGLMFHVKETDGPSYSTGPEIQVQDNVDGHDPQKSGWLYQLYQPPKIDGEVLDATRPAGEWNQIFLRISPQNCEVDLNGVRYYNFRLGDNEWKRRIADSKFAKMEGFGAAGEGHICLQDHGNLVSYRNIKIRDLGTGNEIKQPIDGTLPVRSALAFPKLKWQGWEGIDDNGRPRNFRIMELTYTKSQPHRLFAATQRGVIHTFEHKPDVEQSQVFLDIQDKVSLFTGPGANEQGLLGLAFHPKYESNGEFYVYYTRKSDDAGIVARFKAPQDNLLKADAASEEILLEIPQPFKNHNGGSIEFGPDGFLYIGLGDGGLRNDPLASGQDKSQLLGSILRIDVDKKSGDKAYGIPADNPFVNMEGARPEIYAIGLRNPWRIAFDPQSGRLWTGDVGQELWEEVDVIEKGGNYGWSSREGTHAFGNRPVRDDVSQPISPVWEYDHGVGKSITGGRVYRSDRLPSLNGKYIYADYVSGSVWALTYDEASGRATRNEQLIESGIPVLAFGQDQSGEVFYMIENVRGEAIYRFEAE
ncbi:MAG: PQQ-dependent sugar dehydrogenase [Pirellulaceae bacterium]